MKIAMVSQYYPPGWGGVETHTYELSRELARMNHEVHVFTSRRKERISFHDIVEHENSVVVHRLCGLRISRSTFSPFHMPKLKEYFKKERFEVIHVQHVFSPLGFQSLLSAGLMYPRPPCLVGTNHSIYGGFAEKVLYLFTKRQVTRAMKLADRIIAVSRASKRAIVPPLSEEEVVVIPNGIDTEQFSPRVKPSLNLDGKIVLACGRLVAVKGFDLLIMAAKKVLAEHPSVKFVIVGSGRERRNLVELSRKLGVEKNVVFLGEVPREKLPSIFASSYLVVVPSRKEAASRIILEAMASGKPVVASRTGGLQEFLSDGTWGLFFEPGNHEDLGTKISLLLSDEKMAKEMGRRGRREAEKYSWRHIAERTLNVYLEVMGKEC